MNLIQKCKRNAGFTLFELIVVIAILTILAGVAVPAYSGYIKKAEKAGDLQLLGAVNTAFAAACLEEQISSDTVKSAAIDLDKTTGKVEGVLSVTTQDNTSLSAVPMTGGKVTTLSGASVAKLSEAFMRYFGGNENATFKVIKSLYFNPETHTFEDMPESGEVKMFIGGQTVTVNAEAAQTLANSTYGTAIGANKLLNQVSDVSTLASGLLKDGNETFTNLVFGGTYEADLQASLGMTDEEWTALQQEKGEEGYVEFLANSLVLTTAQTTAGKTASEVTAALTSDTFITDLKTKLDSSDTATAQSGLSDAALVYGMYTSYVYARGTEEEIAGLSSITSYADLKDAMDSISGDDFKDYMNKEGQDDLEGYLSAMQMINDSAQGDTAKQVLTNGFTDPELSGLLTQIMGN